MNILEAVRDPNLFAPWFKHGGSWVAWRAFLAALFGLTMTNDQFAIFKECTGRSAPPQQPATEAWVVCGRRAGKSFILALCAVFLDCFFDYRRHLAPGERATVLIIATNSKQARVIFRYIRALLTHIPMLAKMIGRETADSFDLTNGTTIEVHVASMKTTRGYTIVAALCDEIAFWPHEDAAEPDYEVLNALRPGMATIPNAMLLCASSPYARRGAL
jgi:phage terminase large subunit-like protein